MARRLPSLVSLFTDDCPSKIQHASSRETRKVVHGGIGSADQPVQQASLLKNCLSIPIDLRDAITRFESSDDAGYTINPSQRMRDAGTV